jgi:hypothetical protein
MKCDNGDVVDKIHKPEYKWVLRKKNRYGRYSLEYGDIYLCMKLQKSIKKEIEIHCKSEGFEFVQFVNNVPE